MNSPMFFLVIAPPNVVCNSANFRCAEADGTLVVVVVFIGTRI
jgi:hypothetical protein